MSQITLLENLTYVLETLKRSESLHELNTKFTNMEFRPAIPTVGTVYDRCFWRSPFCSLNIIVTEDCKVYFRVDHGLDYEDYYEVITSDSITPGEVIEALDYLGER